MQHTPPGHPRPGAGSLCPSRNTMARMPPLVPQAVICSVPPEISSLSREWWNLSAVPATIALTYVLPTRLNCLP